MLVLSRKVGEEIRIGNDIVVKVNRVAGGRVSIGVDAPDHIKIVRGELRQLIEEFDEPVQESRRTIVTHDYSSPMPLASRMAR
jgi:carbon storage regulator